MPNRMLTVLRALVLGPFCVSAGWSAGSDGERMVTDEDTGITIRE